MIRILMGKVVFLIFICFALEANAQNYYITFAGAGASTSVNTVKVENLTNGDTPLTLNGNDILRLTATTGINSVKNGLSSEIKVFPNPSTGISKVQVYPPLSGNAVITVFDINGKQVAQIQSYLENYLQEFQLSGLYNGLFLISVRGNNYHYSGKLLSNSNSDGNIVSIKRINSYQAVDENKIKIGEAKGPQATIDMAYTTGDRLKFTGTSGIYSTVLTDIPSSDKTITFNFIACTDGDDNNYPVVRIGTQVWMAENLKTTKDREKTSIPDVADKTGWSTLSTPGLCWYENNAATYKDTYGALYNWYAVGTGKLCPTGWHVPSDVEWAALATFLGGESIAGNKLKETDGTHWYSPWYEPSKATDEYGFTALPGGLRYDDGTFDVMEFGGGWWSSTKIDVTTAYGLVMTYNSSTLLKGWDYKTSGYSIRCLGN